MEEEELNEMPFNPKDHIDWAKELLRLMKDGCIWCTSAGLIYRIDKQNKRLILIADSDPIGNLAYREMNRQVFELVGYRVATCTATPSPISR